MEKQKSRLEMFEQIQRLQRDLADSVWENVDMKHRYVELNKRYNDLKDFFESNRVEIAVGMSIGPDGHRFLVDKVVNSLREEFKKIDEQPKTDR
jgi:hypothetical protein